MNGTPRWTMALGALFALIWGLPALGFATPDSTTSDAPTVLFTSPFDRESYVETNASITIEFSEPMLLDSIIAALNVQPETQFGGIVQSGAVLSLLSVRGLEPNTTYIVNITTEARSVSGVGMDSPYGFHFHTGPGAPEAILWGHVADENGEAVKDATVEVIDAETGEVVATAKTDADGKYYADVPPGRTYYLRIVHPDGKEEKTDPFTMNGDRSAPAGVRPKPPSPVVEPQLPWSEIGTLGALLGLGMLAGAWALGGEAARYALMMAPISLYARMRRDRRRDDFVRGQVYGNILSNPGTTYGVIQKTVGVGNGTLSYHLYHLEREGFVRSERDGWFRRLYPSWAPRGAGDPILSDIQRKIVEIVGTEPGLSQSDIAILMGESRQTVNYNVSRLVDAGFLRLDGWGGQKKCFPAPPKAGPVNVLTPNLPKPGSGRVGPTPRAALPPKSQARPGPMPGAPRPLAPGAKVGAKPSSKTQPKTKKPVKPTTGAPPAKETAPLEPAPVGDSKTADPSGHPAVGEQPGKD